MKNKVISVIVNFALCAIITAVSLVGFAGSEAEEVTVGGDNVYYKSETARGVSLMFNVYQNTENVYKILDILDGAEAKATFFLGGCWADDNVDCVRDIYARGHEIGSHGYFHKDHSKMSYEENLAEIRPSVKLLNAVLNTEISLFAPPSGAFCNGTVAAVSSLGLKTIMWSRDTIDWRDGNADIFIERATENLQNGEFVLMHPMDVTVKALPAVLKYIRENGLTAVTVSYNLGEN